MLATTGRPQLTKMRTSAEAMACLAREKAPGQPAAAAQQVAHPLSSNNNKDLATIMDALQTDYGNYKYTVYRCASKFVALQKVFHSE